MYCKQCGADNNEKSKYCKTCGAPLHDEMKDRAPAVDLESAQVYTKKYGTRYAAAQAAAADRDKPAGNKKKLIVILCIAAVLIVGGAVGAYFFFNSGPRLAEKEIKSGQQYIADEKYDEAIEAFTNVLEIDPGDELAYISLADAYAASGDLEQAVDVLEDARRALPDSGEIVQELAETYIKLGDQMLEDEAYDGAADAFEEAIDLSSEDAENAYAGLFEAYVGLGEKEKALELVDRHEDMLPDAPDAYVTTAILYLDEDDAAGAASIFERLYKDNNSVDFMSRLTNDEIIRLCAYYGLDVRNGVVTAYTGNDAACVIPGYLGITEIGNKAFYECDTLISAIIPDGVTRIGDYAFYGCSNLASISIPDSVTEIGDGAFEGCDKLPGASEQEPETQPVFGDYILPDSDARYLKAGDLSGFNYETLCLAQYEIFARHNCLLGISWVQDYFNTRSWYLGYVAPVNFKDNDLNSFEWSNLSLILEQKQKLTGYILIDSDSRYLSNLDLLGLSDELSCLARNEIFAWHGRLFDVEWIQSYFDSCPWYNGYISPSSFDRSVLNDYELQNIQTLMDYEKRFD